VEEAVNKALLQNKKLSASDLTISKRKQLVKTGFNLPNPEVFVESPTGKFYTGSITQSIEFPTVYLKQKQIRKQEVSIAEKEKALTTLEVKYQIIALYQNAQFADTLQKQLFLLDSIYAGISKTAKRQFEAGQIDFLQKTLSESEYQEVHNQYLQSSISLQSVLRQLQFRMGLAENIRTTPLNSVELIASDTISMNPPAFQILEENKYLTRKNLALQRNKALPGLAFGYFNQGERTTATEQRFRFGFTIPLWFWQYRGNIQAAKSDLKIAEMNAESYQQELAVELMDARKELEINNQNLRYFQSKGAQMAEEIINAASRLFAAGETDYSIYLRTINNAYSMKIKHLEAIRNYNQSILKTNFLTGNL